MSVGAERSVHVCVIELPQARPVVGPRAPVADDHLVVAHRGLFEVGQVEHQRSREERIDTQNQT